MYHPEIDIAQLCRTYFILMSSVVVGMSSIPSIRKLFVLYGPKTADPDATSRSQSQSGLLAEIADKLKVPHSWFGYFYILSVASSIFWAWQLITKGVVFKFIVLHFVWNRTSSMTANQVAITWGALLLQGLRRSYESYTLIKPSKSTMSILAYTVAGFGFYIFVGISVWVEGIPALQYPGISLDSLIISAPSLKTCIAFPMFVMASGIQHDCHVYLSSLKKYTLPNENLFKIIICPHYTAECFIYLAMAIASAPEGSLVNKTVFMVLIFTLVNLSVTADSTKEWYVKKFGKEQVEYRWRILPYVY